MEQGKFEFFSQCVEDAFLKVAAELSGMNFQKKQTLKAPQDEVMVVIVGVVGKNKGRIQLSVSYDMAHKITEAMNGEPFNDRVEMALFLAELTNIFSGHALTAINNAYRGSDLRLTPPAIFAGEQLELATPSIRSRQFAYESAVGDAGLDIGFEGE